MRPLTAKESKRRRRKKELIKKIVSYILLSFFGISMVIPFLWTVSTSLKEPGDIFTHPPQWIPRPVRWENYSDTWKAVPFGRGYINTLIVAITVTAGQVFTSSLAAYAFARLSFPGRDKLFLGYLSTMMIPGAVTMIPVFILFRKLPEFLNTIFRTNFWDTPLYLGPHLIGNPIGMDSYFALIAPGLFSAWGTFMLRQFFMTIPRDLEDAAQIDGTSRFGTYFWVILPLSKPALATLTIFTFMGSWGAFMWPLILTTSMEMKVLPVLIASFQGLYATDWHFLTAASLIALVPMLVVFVIGQRYFIEGIKLGAIKG